MKDERLASEHTGISMGQPETNKTFMFLAERSQGSLSVLIASPYASQKQFKIEKFDDCFFLCDL